MCMILYTVVKKNSYIGVGLLSNSTLLLNYSLLFSENISQKDAEPLDKLPVMWYTTDRE